MRTSYAPRIPTNDHDVAVSRSLFTPAPRRGNDTGAATEAQPIPILPHNLANMSLFPDGAEAENTTTASLENFSGENFSGENSSGEYSSAGNATAPIQMARHKGPGGRRIARKKLARYVSNPERPATPPPVAAVDVPPEPSLILPGPSGPPSSEQPDTEKRNRTRAKAEHRARRARKLEGRSAGPLDTLWTSRTRNPLNAEEVDALEEEGTVDPHRIRTVQGTATSRFTDDTSVSATASDLARYRRGLPPKKKPKAKPKVTRRDIANQNSRRNVARRERGRDWPEEPEIPPINIIRQPDPETGASTAYTLDNRRLVAFRRARVPVRYRLTEGAAAEKDFRRKYSTTDSGNSVRVVPSASERVPYTPEDLHGELEDE